MAGQHFWRLGNELPQHRHGRFAFWAIGFGQMVGHPLAMVVVGLIGLHTGGKFLARQHQDVAVAQAGIEPDLVGGKPAIQRLDQGNSVILGDPSPGKIPQNPIFGIGEVDAEGGVIGAQLDTAPGGFQRAPSAILGGQVTAQHGHIGHFTAGGETFRQGQKGAGPSFAGNPIHAGGPGGLQRGSPPNLRHRLIRHPIAQENYGLPSAHGPLPSDL